jgi:BolA protein
MGEFHALALHTYTPQEWAETGAAPASPTCAGGSKH